VNGAPVTGPEDALTGALWAAGHGWKVHPCNGKVPTTRWADTATDSPDQIVAWLSGTNLNYGIACGPSGLLVVDDDTGHTLLDFAASIGATIPDTATVTTHRGLHYYFQAPAIQLGNQTGQLPSGIDIRGNGGYVIGPGSTHTEGSMYTLTNTTEPAPAPGWLIEAITGRPTHTRNVEQFSAPDDKHRGPIPVGKRHQRLVSYAIRLLHHNMTMREALALTELRWKDCEQPDGNLYPLENVRVLVEDIFGRYTPEHDPQINTFDLEVAAQAERIRVMDAARELVRIENQPPAPPMDVALLDDITDDPVRYRIHNLLPMHGNALIVAKRKSGKSTLLLNIIRSLRHGEPFLGSLNVEPITGRVAFLNYELPRAMFASWAREVGLTSDDLVAVNLRGRRNPLGNIEDSQMLRQHLIDYNVDAIIVDPFSRAFAGQNINDTGEVTRFLADLDIIKTDIGASSLIVAAHAGWGSDRARNSSVLEDWPDAIITMTTDDQSRRYLSAIGRDVELDEDQLDYDSDTRTLTFSGAGGRRVNATADRMAAISEALVDIVRHEPGIDMQGVEKRLRERGIGFQKGDPSKASKMAEGSQLITRIREGRQVRLFHNNMPQHAPKYPEGVPNVPQPPLYRGGVRLGSIDDDIPRAEQLVQQVLGGEVVA